MRRQSTTTCSICALDLDLDNLVHYPFQLRPGLFVFLYLPVRITRDDVARIAEYLRTIAVE